MQKFVVKKSIINFWKFLCICNYFFVVGIPIALGCERRTRSHLVHYVYEWSGREDREIIFLFIMLFVEAVAVSMMAAMIIGQFISVTEDMVYVNAGIGGKAELTYQQIISAYSQNNKVIINALKGTYTLKGIEAAEECVELINMWLDEYRCNAEQSHFV